ncbi:MAG TPA: protein kinase [Bryobacteraceae bacterium]|nr:protein kinase [Bryobacteraceae bacterium]
MDSAIWSRIEQLYQAALTCDPVERTRLLEQASSDVRREVELLLAQEGSLPDLTAWDDEVTASMLVPGRVIGRYEIEALIGKGGMGQVFRARDTRLRRSVAIKTCRDRFSDRFEREARAISALNHPGICTLYDVGPDYLVLELVEGETLAARIRKGSLPVAEILRIASQIAEALAEAHAHQIVHRDLKPSNVMLTRHGVKVLDFGLAKILDDTGITRTRAVMGTPAYMAPEQLEGREPTAATDLFSFGLVLYEMMAGKLPQPGASLGHLLSTTARTVIPAPSRERPDVPAELDRLIASLLSKDPGMRPGAASEVASQLSAIAAKIAEPPPKSRWRSVSPAAVIVLALLLSGGGWVYRQSERRRWAQEDAISQISRLSAKQPLAAFLLLRKAEQILPGDARLAALAESSTRITTVDSTPRAAKVEIQDYLAPGEWFSLGTTPLTNVRVPNGYLRWKISKPGEGEFVVGAMAKGPVKLAFPAALGAKSGTVPVPGGPFVSAIDFVGWLRYDLPAFDIDQFEVTNARFQQFVDQGGYQKPGYWKEKFEKDGKTLSWQEAMDLFRDPTGRPGPSTWDGGHFLPGQGSYPVSGVSWYEAAAYAVFAGRSLPSIGQFFKAAPPDMAPFVIDQSNFAGPGLAKVGKFAGVGPWGTYDMAGNVREWSLTAVSGGRFILGGSAGSQTYEAADPGVLPPFDRSRMNGFRTVYNRAPLSAEAAAPVSMHSRDFSTAKPVSDEVFQVYKTMYAYDQNPLNPKIDGIIEDAPSWTKQKVTFDAGYENQRLEAYLFLPKNVHPPFQAVVFFPSARVQFMADSRTLGDMQFIDYVIKSGRALIYPIYAGTYERVTTRWDRAGASESLQLLIRRSKEVRRSVDYLRTRPEIDAAKVAYIGVSMGSAYGVIFTALEDRFRALVFLDGGLFLGPPMRGADQVDFAPRVTKPVLLVNGRYDFTFSPNRSQDPLIRLLGTPDADKRKVVLDTPHDVSQQKSALSKEVLSWLDKYLGRID